MVFLVRKALEGKKAEKANRVHLENEAAKVTEVKRESKESLVWMLHALLDPMVFPYQAADGDHQK